MAEPTSPADVLAESIDANVRTVSVDGLTTTTHSIPDLIAADKHLGEKKVASNPFGALRMAKLRPPGTT